MCDLDSASVVEDHGGFQSINTAAHELGHRYDRALRAEVASICYDVTLDLRCSFLTYSNVLLRVWF